MSLKPYPHLNDSGIQQLGKIPAHWDMSRLGYEAWVRARLGWKGLKAEEYVESGYVLLATPNIKEREIDFSNVNFISQERWDESPEIQLDLGDVMLAKDGSTLGIVNIVRELACCATVNSSIAVITPGNRLLGLYLHYALQTSFIQATIQRLKGGMGVPHLFQDDIVRFPLPLPPLTEQRAIATFLDRETAKIDALVAEQERLIALLTEKRRAVISHAVTKGLDPNAPMKDSGIAWLGEVPAHWEVKRLKHLFSFIKRQEKAELPILSVYRDFGVIEKASRDDNINKTPDDLSLYQTVDSSYLVVNKMKAWQGSLGISQLYGITSPDYAAFRPRHAESDQFLNYFLRCQLLPDVYRSISNGIRPDQWRLEPDRFLQIEVALPSSEEQLAITAYLDRETVKLDTLTTEAERAISLLKERRAALISAAVTGKIDVRDVNTPVQIDKSRLRLVLAATIIETIAHKPGSGRTKVHKITYLAETHAGIHELQGSYVRQAAGPLDWKMITETEAQLQSSGHITVEQPDGHGTPVTYKVVGQRGAFRNELQSSLGSRAGTLDRLIVDLADLDTKSVEAIATLYAVWNDALIDGALPTDREIVAGVLNDWHPDKKKKFTTSELQVWLGWMRRHHLVPKGEGPRTQMNRLFP